MGGKRHIKASREVQILMKRATEQGWTITNTAASRMMFRSPAGGAVVVSPRPQYRSLKNTEAELRRAGLLDETPKKVYIPPPDQEGSMTLTAPVGEAARISIARHPLDRTKKSHTDYNVEEKSVLVWEYAIAQCTNYHVPRTNFNGTDYYVWTRTSMADLIGGIFPEISGYEGADGTRPIYDYLRATGNTVNLTEKVGPESRKWKWLIRCEWSSTKASTTPVPDAVAMAEQKHRDAERKVTPHEAGEDRQAAAPKPAPAPAPVPSGSPPTSQSEDTRKVVMVDGRYQCGVCDYTSEKIRYVSAHMKAHVGKKRAPNKGSNICPECRQVDKFYKAKSPAGLGSHRWRVHGVAGTSETSKKEKQRHLSSNTVVVNPPTVVEVVEIVEAVKGPDMAVDIDSAVAEFRAKLLAEAGGADALKVRAEKAEATVEAIKEALATLPLPQAMARIVEITAP